MSMFKEQPSKHSSSLNQILNVASFHAAACGPEIGVAKDSYIRGKAVRVQVEYK